MERSTVQSCLAALVFLPKRWCRHSPQPGLSALISRRWANHNGAIRSGRIFARSGWPAVTAAVPRVGDAFGFGAGRGFLACLQRVERTAAVTGVIDALDTKWILRRGWLAQGSGRHSANSKQRQKNIAHHRPLEGGFRHLPTRYAASCGPSMQKRPICEATGSWMPSASLLT
jgi:hypothetical protein